MSIEAHRWALCQRSRNATTQCVLYVLANAAEPDGVAFRWWRRRDHWWPYITERTCASRAQVFRVMHELEEAGFLSIETIVTADGERPSRSTCLVELHLNRYFQWDHTVGAYMEVSEPKPIVPSHHETEETERGGDLDPVPSHHETEQEAAPVDNSVENSNPSLTMRLTASHPETPYKNPLTKSPGKESPPTPSALVEPIGFRSCFEEYLDWQVMPRDKAVAEYLKLSKADRELLAKAIPLHVDKLRRLHRKPKNFHLWVRARGFAAYAAGAGAAGTRVFVEEGTDAWRAWCNLYAVAFATQPRIPSFAVGRGPNGKLGGMVASAWPPGGEGWLAPRSTWGFVEEYTPNFNRYRERICEILNRMPLIDHAQGPRESWLIARNGEGWDKQKLPIRGLCVPARWPPPKNAGSSDAEELPELSDDDVSALVEN